MILNKRPNIFNVCKNVDKLIKCIYNILQRHIKNSMFVVCMFEVNKYWKFEFQMSGTIFNLFF